MVNPRVFRLIGYRTGSVFSDEPTGPTSEAVYVEDTTAVVGYEGEREYLRAAQAGAVMPLIGPLLDAWECCSQDVRSENPGLGKYLSQINRAMEDAGEPPDVRIEASLRYLENRELNAYAAARYNEPQEPPCPTK